MLSESVQCPGLLVFLAGGQASISGGAAKQVPMLTPMGKDALPFSQAADAFLLRCWLDDLQASRFTCMLMPGARFCPSRRTFDCLD